MQKYGKLYYETSGDRSCIDIGVGERFMFFLEFEIPNPHEILEIHTRETDACFLNNNILIE